MNKLTIVLILLTLAGCNNEQPRKHLSVSNRDVLRILDINVWSGLNYQGYLWMGEYETAEMREQRYQVLFKQIQKLAPDIIGIHEANKLPDYAERLSRDLNYDVFFHVGVGGIRLGKVGLPWNLREGDAILTRPELGANYVGRKQLSGGHVGSFFTFHFDDATQVLAVKLCNKGQEWFVFATHWHASPLETREIHQSITKLQRSNANKVALTQWRDLVNKGANQRLAESQRTIEYIRRATQGNPFILMGDFNSTEELPEIKNLLNFGAVDSYRLANKDSAGFTWNPLKNRNFQIHYLPEQAAQKDSSLFTELKHKHQSTAKRIDFIFIGPGALLKSREIAIASSRVVLDEALNGVHASDHFGVLTEVVLE